MRKLSNLVTRYGEQLMCDEEGEQLLLLICKGEKPSIQVEWSEGPWILRCRKRGTTSKGCASKKWRGFLRRSQWLISGRSNSKKSRWCLYRALAEDSPNPQSLELQSVPTTVGGGEGICVLEEEEDEVEKGRDGDKIKKQIY